MKLFKTTFVFSVLLLSLVSCIKEPPVVNQKQDPIVVENEDGTTFTVTPDDLEKAEFTISEDKKNYHFRWKKN